MTKSASTRSERAIKGGLTGILQNLIQILTQLVISPLLLFYAGQEALGGYAIIMQIVGLSVILDFGVSSSFTRNLCHSFVNNSVTPAFMKIIGSARLLIFLLNILVATSLLIIAFNVEAFVHGTDDIVKDSRVALTIMAAWYFLRAPLYVYNTALIATQNLALNNFIAISANAIRLVTALIFVYSGLGIVGLIISNVITEIIQYSVQRYYFMKMYGDYEKSTYTHSRETIDAIIKFGMSYWGVNLSVVLLLGSDNIIAGHIFGAATASIYYSTKMFGSLMIQFAARLIDSAYPGLNEIAAEGNRDALISGYLRLLRYSLLLLVPSVIGIVLFTEELVTIWLVREQFAGQLMAVFLAVFVAIQIMNHLHGITTLATGALKNWSTISIACGLLSIGLAYLFGLSFGLEWIMAGMSIAMLPLMYFLMRKVHRSVGYSFSQLLNDVLRPVGKVTVGILSIVLLSIFMGVSYTGFEVIYVGFIYLLASGASMYIFGMSPNEKERVGLLVRRMSG